MTTVNYSTAQFKADIAQAAQAELLRIAAKVRPAIDAEFSEPKSGHFYPRKGRGHRASAQGETPAHDTRALINSVREPRIDSEFRVVVEIGARHAEILEGTDGRPGTRPFVQAVKERVEQESG